MRGTFWYYSCTTFDVHFFECVSHQRSAGIGQVPEGRAVHCGVRPWCRVANSYLSQLSYCLARSRGTDDSDLDYPSRVFDDERTRAVIVTLSCASVTMRIIRLSSQLTYFHVVFGVCPLGATIKATFLGESIPQAFGWSRSGSLQPLGHCSKEEPNGWGVHCWNQ